MFCRSAIRLGPGVRERPRFSFLTKAGKIVVGATCGIGITYGTLYTYFSVSPFHSLTYLGQSPEFESELNKEFGLSTAELSTITNQMFWHTMADPDKSKKGNITKAEQFVAKYPDSVAGYMLLAWAHRVDQQPEPAKNAWKQGVEVMNRCPEKNAAFALWMPMTEAEYTASSAIKPTEVTELQPGKIWTALGYWKNPKVPDPNQLTEPVALQASIVKLKNSDDLVIINPCSFDKASIDKINSLGTVKHMITTCVGHGNNLADATNIWPNAKLYGTDSNAKHDFPKLPWNAFLSDVDQQFKPDLQHVKLDGHMFQESVFYHPETKTLLGPVDMAIATPANSQNVMDKMYSNPPSPKSFTGMMYFCGQGLWRGSKTQPVGCQSYHYMFTNNYSKLRQGVQNMLALDFDRYVLGHGGVVEGPEAKQHLQEAFKWLTSPDIYISRTERLVLPVQWVRKNQIFGAFMKMMMKKKEN